MKVMFRLSYWALCIILLSTSVFAKTVVGEIKTGEYDVNPVHSYNPFPYKTAQEYFDNLQKVDLQLGNEESFRDLPKLGMKKPYTGYITLGDKPQKFGVIVDIYGQEKRLYIDTDGDGSFAGEPMVVLLNEWQGMQVYWVVAPEPIQLKVTYDSAGGKTFPIQISVSGLLNPTGVVIKEKPYLRINVRTWFLVKINEAGYEKYGAIVDFNNNGRFNDPQDRFFLDYNNNRFFNPNEAIIIKKGVNLKSGKSKTTLDWQAYPEKVIVGGDKR